MRMPLFIRLDPIIKDILERAGYTPDDIEKLCEKVGKERILAMDDPTMLLQYLASLKEKELESARPKAPVDDAESVVSDNDVAAFTVPSPPDFAEKIALIDSQFKNLNTRVSMLELPGFYCPIAQFFPPQTLPGGSYTPPANGPPICKFFANGCCNRGDKCRFRHSLV